MPGYPINYYMFFAGIIILFAGGYYRRVFAAVTAFVWTVLGAEAIIMVLWHFGILPYQEPYHYWMITMGAGLIVAAAAAAAPKPMIAVTSTLFFFVVICVIVEAIDAARQVEEYWAKVTIMGVAALGAGTYSVKRDETMHRTISAFTGALLTCFAVCGIIKGIQAWLLIAPMLRGNVLSTPGYPWLIAVGVVFIPGLIFQSNSEKVKKSAKVRHAQVEGHFRFTDVMWKHWVIIALAVFGLVLVPLCRIIAGGNTGSVLYKPAVYILDNSTVAGYAAEGLFLAGLIFFTINYRIYVSLFYCVLGLVWIPAQIFLLKSRPYADMGALLFWLNVVHYFVLWAFMLGIKEMTVLRRLSQTIIGIAAAVVLYPYAWLILLTGVYRFSKPDTPVYVFWAVIAAGSLIFTFMADPIYAKNSRTVWYRGKGARYCRECGDRRRKGYICCGTCGTKYREGVSS